MSVPREGRASTPVSMGGGGEGKQRGLATYPRSRSGCMMEQDGSPPGASEGKTHSPCCSPCSGAFLRGIQEAEHLLPKFTVVNRECVSSIFLWVFIVINLMVIFFLRKNYKSTLKTKNLLLLVLYFFFFLASQPLYQGSGEEKEGSRF